MALQGLQQREEQLLLNVIVGYKLEPSQSPGLHPQSLRSPSNALHRGDPSQSTYAKNGCRLGIACWVVKNLFWARVYSQVLGHGISHADSLMYGRMLKSIQSGPMWWGN